jgi:hypothetical protein
MRRLALAVALTATGCATGFASSSADYRDYRATRVAPTLEKRLAAAQRYLEQRPTGVFHTEVRGWFIRAEDAFYSSKKGSRTGLAAYLDALPRGPHKEAAAQRIEALDAISRSAELDKLAAGVEARVSGPGALARTQVRKELDAWLSRFLDPKVFRAPMSQAKADLVIPFSLSLPAPRCEILEPAQGRAARRCAKLLELPYEILKPEGPEPREATVEITVLEDAFGTPLEATLGGPDLFLRLEETYRIVPMASDDPAQRAAAAARAAAFVRRVFAHAVSDGERCARPAQGPAAVRLACEGMQVEVFPASTPGEDDTIVMVPVAPRGD